METKRKGVGNAKRFKVFERDGYQCRYCGMKPPEVVLHVDHFIPVVKGGGNEMDNLLTSCSQCNQGKKARVSRPPTEHLQNEHVIEEKKEVIRQLKKIAELNIKIDYELECMVDDISNHWTYLSDGKMQLNKRGRISIRVFLKTFQPNKIIEAMDLAVSQTSNQTNTFKYMCGILQNWKKDVTTKPNTQYE